MPVQYRNFYVRKLVKDQENEKKQMEKATNSHSSSTPLPRGPSIKK